MITTEVLVDTLNSLKAHRTVQEVMDAYGIDVSQVEIDNLALQTMMGIGNQFREGTIDGSDDADRLEIVMTMVEYALVTGLAAGLKLERAAQLERMVA